ncbi:DUF746 domain-containing protein [Ralstonia pseudosolanacearum]|uniref:DUF746 domain-containing protein n=1 Tax=Ralstonia pseudosolanacearum TaxID=1310165 RepID=UPI0026FB5578|nr:DUF746 domain-containing protein [Ralstonia pseudosolanacearum]MDO3617328.1 DUF746 domain-containing protein [Ralstonia pseudosolanacearum]
MGAISAREPVDDALTEDLEFTAFLTREWQALVNLRSTPLPRCPHCDGLRVRADGIKRASKLPVFFCHGCKKSFNRLTGTPFAHQVDRVKGAAMIPLLSRQMSLLQAGKRLGRSQKAVLSWSLAFRRYLLELDPSGRWEARVRLGVRVAPHARCTHCGFEGGFKSGGFDPQGRRRVRCPQCGRSRLLDAMQKEGLAFEGVVMHDPIDTAVRARRKIYPDMPVPEVSRGVSVDDAAPVVETRQLPRLADIALPDRRRLAGPPKRRDDPELSAFLLERIDASLSASTTPDLCPWCGSGRTEHHPAPRPNGLPGFRCRACLAYYTRVSNTPLIYPNARAQAYRLLPMLGWRETCAAAADTLGMQSSTLQTWIRSWRQWLLLLDSSGAMESRVMLGLRTKKAESGNPVRATTRTRPREPQFIGPPGQAKRTPASVIDVAVKHATVWIASPRKISEAPPQDDWVTWHQMRAVKRVKWTFRPWKRSANGDAYLRADGYISRVQDCASSWRFEIQEIGAPEISQAGGGYPSSEAARLAAFDAITAMLDRTRLGAVVMERTNEGR